MGWDKNHATNEKFIGEQAEIKEKAKNERKSSFNDVNKTEFFLILFRQYKLNLIFQKINKILLK